MKTINQTLLFYSIIAIGFSAFLLNSFHPTSFKLAAVQSVIGTSYEIGNFSIKNGGQKTPLYITGVKTEPNNINKTLENLTSDMSPVSYKDPYINFSSPIIISPGETKTITFKTSSLPDSDTSLKISQVIYQTSNKASYTKDVNIIFAIKAQSKSKSNLVTSFSAKSNSSCQADPSVVCNPNFRKDNSDIIKDIEKQAGQRDRDNQLVTYVPTSEENWLSINANVRTGARYQDLAKDFPGFIKPEIIHLPREVAASEENLSKACSGGVDQDINELASLINQKNTLEFALDGPYNLPSLSVASNKCVTAPSYENGTFDDVFYYIPNGDCKSGLEEEIQKELDKVNENISKAKLALFKEGKIDNEALSEEDSKSISKQDNLNNTRKAALNCSDSLSKDDEISKEDFELIKPLYGNACSQAQETYKQFNPITDAPEIENTSEGHVVIRDNSLSRLTNSDLFKNKPITKPLGGLCTGITDHVNWAFSNVNFVGGNNCNQRVTTKLNTRSNEIRFNNRQCISIECGSYNEWVNTIIDEVLREKSSEDLSEEQITAEVWDRIGVTEICSVDNFFNSPLLSSISDVPSIRKDLNIKFSDEELYGNLSDNVFSSLYNLELFEEISDDYKDDVSIMNENILYLLDDILDGYMVNLKVGFSAYGTDFGAHVVFTHSCELDKSSNQLKLNIFDSNHPKEVTSLMYDDINGSLISDHSYLSPWLLADFDSPFRPLNQCQEK